MEDKNKPAAQPQGKPMAWQLMMNGDQKEISGRIGPPPSWENLKRHGYRVEPLYAEQPASVAVKHTMRSIMEAVERSSEYTILTSNQCAALAAALNTTRPAHANPPPGTEPCGTHHDNDGLDDYRNTK